VSAAVDLLIVGAGIVGAACARAAAQAGLTVEVVDSGLVGGGTTAAGMGHLVVMDDSEPQFALTSYSRSLWRELAPQVPANVEWDRCGTLWVAADQLEMAEVRRKFQYYSERGVRVEMLDEQGLAAAEPRLRRGLAGGLVVPDDAVIYPPCAAQFLLDQAVAAGARVRLGARVAEVTTSGGVKLTDGTAMAAARTLIAAGVWSPEMVPGLPVRRRKGHLVITDRYPGFVRHQLVELGYLQSAHTLGKESVACNIQPRKTGQILIGSSRQFDAEDAGIDHPLLTRMLQRAITYLPALKDLSAIRAWTGHRAATPDKLPIIGPSPDNDRVWLATGHEGLGITTSLGTAALLRDLLLGRTPAIAAASYAPNRFDNRRLWHG